MQVYSWSKATLMNHQNSDVAIEISVVNMVDWPVELLAMLSIYTQCSYVAICKLDIDIMGIPQWVSLYGMQDKLLV